MSEVNLKMVINYRESLELPHTTFIITASLK